NTGVANQCLKQSGVGNQLVWQDCDGGSGGSSATLQTVYNNSVNPELTLNSSVGGLTIRDSSTPLGANLFEIQNNAGSTTYLAVTVSGVSITGAASATGNINSSGGALQTNGTNRIDNSGNMVNIGSITGSGAISIASVGAGNDITIDGTDQFIVQDASVFNALSTFNANIDLGGNDIVGTTADINLSNFDVTGATGDVTAGTYNGQTISSAANFTGTVAVAGNTTLTGDVAVNGGDITSTGALNITPNGILTVGVTGQQLILQGNASTQLTATGGGFTTTVGFTGSPTAAVTYNFDRAATTGTYTICTTIGNCAGTGGGVTTSGGTTGTLPKFTGAQTLGDSLVSESGSTVTVNGNLNLITGNQFQINGTQISSANLSNDANLAKLSASQTFTGNTVAFQNAANSTNALNIQNQAGTRILTADSTNGRIVLGSSSALDGKLVFHNVSNANTVTIQPGTPGGNRTLTLPDADGIICTDSGNCAGAGATLQTAYNFSVGGTTPKIKVNSSLGAVDIQDADTPIAANLFNIRASNSSGLGSVLFGVGNTGQVTLQNSSNSTTSLRLLTAGGTSVLTGDTVNGAIILGQSGTLSGSLVFNNAANSNTTTIDLATPGTNRTITLPNASGTVCLSSGNCSGAGSSNTLQAAYDAGNSILTSNGRDIQFQLADTATDGNFTVDLQCDTACGANGRFAIQDDGIDVFTIASNGNITATGTYNTNTFTANSLQFGAASTATIQSAASQALTITSNAGATWSTSSGDLAIQAAGVLNVGNAGGTAINIGTNNAAHTISIGNAGATGVQTITMGGSGNASNTLVLEGGTGATAIQIGNGATAHGIQIGTGAAVQTIVIGSTNTTSTTTIQAGTGGLVLSTNSASASITAKSSTNGTAAFRVLNASDVPQFAIDTSNSRVYIGNPTADSTGALLVLDTKDTSGDPTGVNGGMYYNSNSGKFRCYEGSAWKNCLGMNETIAFNGTSGDGAASQWVDMPNAETELFIGTGFSQPSSRVRFDLSDATEARFIANVATAANSTAELRVQYSTDQSSWSYLDGSTGPSNVVGTVGTKVSSWVTVASGAKSDVYLRVVGVNGNLSDPRFGLIQLQIR
ncbi:MAG TPA: hypothetical protein VFM05_06205, partial [Candidatus Saccharimonadales bacterium]|nr:hypothetical protein [Candidatus Saccharimonadales bacterium]